MNACSWRQFSCSRAGLVSALGLWFFWQASGAILTREPYLQLASPTAITVRWRTDLPVACRLIWGASPESLDHTNAMPQPATEHEIRLAGLEPSTRYYYALATGDTVLSPADTNQYWQTPPLPAETHTTRFWMLGDPGLNTVDQGAVISAFRSAIWTNRTDLILLAGDNAYWSGLDAEYQTGLFDPCAFAFRNTPVWPSPGNHDTAQLTNNVFNYPYFENFTMPTNGEAGGVPSGTESYYSFDFANIHFVSLNSFTEDRATNGPMATWLKADLAANRQPWLVAYWHHPPYSRGSHDADTEVECVEMRQNFVTLLEEYGVDLVLCGHSHAYERSFLLDGHYGMRSDLSTAMKLNVGDGRENGDGPYLKPFGAGIPRYGAVYVAAGNSSIIRGGQLDDPVMCVATNVFGSLLVQVNSNRLDAVLLSPGGITNDLFTIIKTNFAPLAQARTVGLDANKSAGISVNGVDPNRDPLTYRLFSMPTHGVIRDFDAIKGSLSYTPSWGFVGLDSFSFQSTDGVLSSLPARVSLEVASPPDANQNQLPDTWEALHRVSDPQADEDGDGLSNLQEYLAGTDPRDAESRLRISAFTGNHTSGFTLGWRSIGGVRYRVLFADAEPGKEFPSNFQPVIRSAIEETDLSPLGNRSRQQFIDDFSITGPPSGRARYYRIQIVR